LWRSPDNRRFAFNVEQSDKEEMWVMENFLPAAKSAAKQ
jgi:hypothetical protein